MRSEAARSTQTRIRDNARYVRQTGYDHPGIQHELLERAADGDLEAQEHMSLSQEEAKKRLEVRKTNPFGPTWAAKQASDTRSLYRRCMSIIGRLHGRVPKLLVEAVEAGSLVEARKMLDGYLVRQGMKIEASSWKALEKQAEKAMKACPKCNGTGRKKMFDSDQTKDCPYCDEGKIPAAGMGA